MGCYDGAEEIGEGATIVAGKGYRRGDKLLAAAGGVVDTVGQQGKGKKGLALVVEEVEEGARPLWRSDEGDKGRDWRR
ncbi:hypothetical protein B296_00006290 [Ensete ventricosum]|uniref:Uncharacterized protein n=1 Tax=Ensete ventricosum TaxID=4639 RepID=A0A427AUJ1_ENSVE|nr:hypothetical protein B296_00006290 [Ensete ventricosum]